MATAFPGLSARDLRLSVASDDRLQRIIDLPALDVPSGQLLVLTGPSGSGKSSLLYLLSGLLTPDSGSVLWGGQDLARLAEGARDQWRRRNAGFVFQDFHLIDELSPIDNVLAPAWFGGFAIGQHRTRALALLERFAVPHDRRRASLLSRGERQRVALARALLFAPPVIFADEPTASLDAASGARVAAELRDLARHEGCTVIAASHDPALIALADRALRLERGAVTRETA